MTRGRHQKWVCMDCKAEFMVQNSAPKLCCSCGSSNIGRAPSYELAINFDVKRNELQEICKELNPVYQKFTELKKKYDDNMGYWKQQKRRGYISAEECSELARMYDGARLFDEND